MVLVPIPAYADGAPDELPAALFRRAREEPVARPACSALARAVRAPQARGAVSGIDAYNNGRARGGREARLQLSGE